jgi:hypothetical protein
LAQRLTQAGVGTALQQQDKRQGRDHLVTIHLLHHLMRRY